MQYGKNEYNKKNLFMDSICKPYIIIWLLPTKKAVIQNLSIHKILIE